MFISLLVPSYRRPTDLARCLDALSRQSRPADQILVVARVGDSETISLAQTWRDRLPLELVEVTAPGQVHALNAGLARCAGDIVAITDDDAAPRPQWLELIEGYFASDPKIGGVGGRDWIHNDNAIKAGEVAIVGRVLWFGRIVGDHHRGAGVARDVDILKGANCAYRMTAIKNIGFDTRLRGAGAQVHNDLLLSLAVRRAGWRLLYDPAVAVDHFPAQRFDQDRRNEFNPVATADRAYNLRLALATISPGWKRLTAMLWYYLVGTVDEPGMLNFFRMLMKRDPHAARKLLAAHPVLGRR